MRTFFIGLSVLLFSAQAIAEDRAIAKLFSQQGIEGAMVISSLHGGQTFTHNELRARHRFAAASTFKILNTLIALEENAVSGKDDVFSWDAHSYAISDWNHDQTLESAFKVSCVWCFQKLAHRIGVKAYKSYLKKTAYGKLHEPFAETTFWLDGSLEISAIEQVAFLKKLYQHALPFRASSYETLRQIMLVEQTPFFTIRAKTGLASQAKPHVGWYIGYVETSTDIWFFATNLVIRDEKDLPMRLKLTREALQIKGIIE